MEVASINCVFFTVNGSSDWSEQSQNIDVASRSEKLAF